MGAFTEALGLWLQTGRDALLAYRPDRNPLMGRCPGNVVGKADRRGNLYPAKQPPEQKIDAAVALMMAIGRAMAADAGRPEISDFFRGPSLPECPSTKFMSGPSASP